MEILRRVQLLNKKKIVYKYPIIQISISYGSQREKFPNMFYFGSIKLLAHVGNQNKAV